jgi:hypothetical protein
MGLIDSGRASKIKPEGKFVNDIFNATKIN